MNSYMKFAEIYDSLMKEDINYDEWIEYIEKIFSRFDKNPKIICDLACGTGNFTIPLAKRGYDMIGADKSVEMLNIAREKAADENIIFLNQSISRLDLFGGCDAFLCMIDGLNYILSPKVLYKSLKRIRECFLEPGGIVIFDISSPYKLKNYLGNNSFIYNGEEVFYTCENKLHERTKISDMYLNFFVKSGKGYKRFSERHLQRVYGIEEMTKILHLAGFLKVDVFSPLTFENPKENDMRYVFVAR